MQRTRSNRNRIGRAALLAAALVALGPTARAGDDAAPAVGLDQLLKIPPSVRFEPTTRGHSTRAEWRARFDETRADLEKSRADLAETQGKLSVLGNSSGAWTMGAPGLSNVDRDIANEAPLDQTLSKEMKRHREEVERNERRLRELEVEANLANVPEDWRGTPVPDAPEPESQALR